MYRLYREFPLCMKEENVIGRLYHSPNHYKKLSCTLFYFIFISMFWSILHRLTLKCSNYQLTNFFLSNWQVKTFVMHSLYKFSNRKHCFKSIQSLFIDFNLFGVNKIRFSQTFSLPKKAYGTHTIFFFPFLFKPPKQCLFLFFKKSWDWSG